MARRKDPDRRCCRHAGEQFETFWDDELQQWRYRDAKHLDAAEAARYAFQSVMRCCTLCYEYSIVLQGFQ